MLKLRSIDFANLKTDAILIPVCRNKPIYDEKQINSLVNKALTLKEFKGKKGEQLVLHNTPHLQSSRIILIGLGDVSEIDPEALRAASGSAVKFCIKNKFSELSILIPLANKMKQTRSGLLESIMEGALLGNHLFDKYKSRKKYKKLKKIDLIVKPADRKKFGNLLTQTKIVCDGTLLAREWVSTPPNEKRPEQFIKDMVRTAKKEHLKVTVFKEKELKQKQFGGILAVAAGSLSKPGLVILEHDPKEAGPSVVLVGKGVTFDSGGINIKSTAGIADMKMDMAGAAAVAATVITAARINLGIKLTGIIPVVENMPSGSASRPGDVIKIYGGKTVEIGNTDAEGRLILSDAISYAIKKYKPELLIDMATLTGACVVALGEKIAGVFSSDAKLAQKIVLSGEKTHERCWHMPMPDDYKELLKSEFADIHNMSSSPYGGAITAALFLSEFTGDTRWAHIDIAGPAYSKKASAYCTPGGTGFGVRLLHDLLLTLYSDI